MPPLLWPTSTAGSRCASKRRQMCSAHSASETSETGVLSLPRLGRSGASTLCPARSSSGTTLYQHQPPCQAPWTKMYVLISASSSLALLPELARGYTSRAATSRGDLFIAGSWLLQHRHL